MPLIQFLRTADPAKIPPGLEAGEVAFHLANHWMFLGVGGDDILVRGQPLAAYGASATILGVAGVTVPAKPTGKGYEIIELEGGGVTFGVTDPAPASSAEGQLFVNTAGAGVPTLKVFDGTAWQALNPPIHVGAARPLAGTEGDLFVDTSGTGVPQVVVWDGAAWQPVGPPPQIFSLTDTTVQGATGTGTTAKANAALIAQAGNGIAAAGDIRPGAMLRITSAAATPQVDAPVGGYVYDGTNWQALGSVPGDATARTGTAATGTGGTKGVVYLARDIDVAETSAPGSVVPDPLAVPTAAQLKAVVDRFAGMVTGQTMLGTYDATAGTIATVAPAASAAGRGAFTVGGRIGAGANAKPGDYFRIGTAGTVSGETGAAQSLNTKTFSVGDYVVFDGAEWHGLAVPPPPNPTIHGMADVSDSVVAAVTPANFKGVLVRDASVAADGDPNAYKLVNVLDLGVIP